MSTIVRQKLELIRDTQDFINLYLSQKNKGIDKKVYLSIYINLEKVKSSKLVHLKKKMREVNMALNSKLKPDLASGILTSFSKFNILELAKYNLKSFVVFATDNFIGFLPINDDVQEGVYVSKSLHLKPIIKWIYNWNQYYVITLSQKSIRLLKGDDFELNEIDKIDYEDYNLSDDVSKPKNLFFKHSLEKVNSIISKDNLPVILAGVKENIDLSKKYCKDPDLSIYYLIGNYDHTSFDEIHQQSLKILNQISFDQDIILKTEIRNQKSKIEKDLDMIIKSATMGRIQKLLVAKDKILWGEIDKKTGNYELFMNQNLAIPEDDILDDLAEIVLAKGGKITVLEQREIPYKLEALALVK